MADGPFKTSDNSYTGVQGFSPDGGSVEATVTFGEIAADDEAALYQIDDNSGVWEDGYVINRYERDKGLFGNGLTSPGGFNGNSTAVVQLYSETLLLVCDWTFERTGRPPNIPNPEPKDDNMVLMDEHVEPVMKVELQGGTAGDIRYRIHGTYVYWFLNPALAPYHFPTPPWLVPGSGECELSEDLYVDDIIMCEGGSSGATGASPDDSGSQNQPTNPSQVGSFPQS